MLPLLRMPLPKFALGSLPSMIIHMRMVRNDTLAPLFVVLGFQRHGVFEVVCCLVEGVVVFASVSIRLAGNAKGGMVTFLVVFDVCVGDGGDEPDGAGDVVRVCAHDGGDECEDLYVLQREWAREYKSWGIILVVEVDLVRIYGFCVRFVLFVSGWFDGLTSRATTVCRWRRTTNREGLLA
jgi:hypothetical protein